MTQTTLEQIFIKLAKEQIESAETAKDVGTDTSYKLKDKSLFPPCKQGSMKNKLQNILPFWFRDQGRDWGRGFFPKIKSFFKNAFEVVRWNFSSGRRRCKEQRIFPGNSFDNSNDNQNLDEDGIDAEVEVEVEVGIVDDNAMETLLSSCPINIIDPLGLDISTLLMTSSDYIPINTDVAADEMIGEEQEEEQEEETGKLKGEGWKEEKEDEDEDAGCTEVTHFRFV